MTDASVEQIEEILQSARGLPDSAAKVSLYESAIRIADVLGETKISYDLRHEMLGMALGAGLPDALTTAFTWCLGQSDRDPQRFPEERLLWEYRWVIHELTTFPQVPRAQFDGLFEDMKTRYLRAGSTLRAFYTLRRKVMMEMGDADEARRMDEAFLASRRDWLTDSDVSELSFRIEWYSWNERDAEAIAAAAPVLSGKMTSMVVPHCTYPDLIMPALRTDDYTLLMRCYGVGYPLIARKHRFLKETGRYMLLLAATHNFAQGIKLLELHVPQALAGHNLATRFDVLSGAWILCDALARHKPDTAVRVPEAVAPAGAGVVALRDRLLEMTLELADLFDARNGNAHFHRKMADFVAVLALGRPHPLPRSSSTGGKAEKFLGDSKY